MGSVPHEITSPGMAMWVAQTPTAHCLCLIGPRGLAPLDPVGVSAWQGFCLAPAATPGLEQPGRWQGLGRAHLDPSSQVSEEPWVPGALGVRPARPGLAQGHPAGWGGGDAGRSRAR